jgi:drug/metabolite transporter (DMT)-like permease
MTKIVAVIAIAALSAAIGESLLSYGMRKYGEMSLTSVGGVFALVSAVVRNPFVFLGVVFLAVFFFLYLAALSWADLSFVLPFTAMSYIFAAVLAKFFLREDVSWLRWVGTLCIVLGIIFVALDGRTKTVGSAAGRELQSGHVDRGIPGAGSGRQAGS